ncbi:MAG: hypothetical protein AB1798_23130, partial [Spirochaetota bacterium]
MNQKPSLEELKQLCPDIDPDFLTLHATSLSIKYFSSFDDREIQSHLNALASLSPQKPCALLFAEKPDSLCECSILAFDYPGVFSLITGLLAASGFDIISGNIFTYSWIDKPRKNARRTRYYAMPGFTKLDIKKRKIIDRFTGRLDGSISPEAWKVFFEKRLSDLFTLLESNEPESIKRAKQTINEAVVEALSEKEIKTESVLFPIQIEVDALGSSMTKMKIISQDTPFFLYSLSNALALHDISIETVSIHTRQNRIEDEFEFVDLNGRPITDPQKINQIKFSILFTKQFTYFLGKA